MNISLSDRQMLELGPKNVLPVCLFLAAPQEFWRSAVTIVIVGRGVGGDERAKHPKLLLFLD